MTPFLLLCGADNHEISPSFTHPFLSICTAEALVLYKVCSSDLHFWVVIIEEIYSHPHRGWRSLLSLSVEIHAYLFITNKQVCIPRQCDRKHLKPYISMSAVASCCWVAAIFVVCVLTTEGGLLTISCICLLS